MHNLILGMSNKINLGNLGGAPSDCLILTPLIISHFGASINKEPFHPHDTDFY